MDTSDERRNTTTITERPDIAAAQYLRDIYNQRAMDHGVQSVRLSTSVTSGTRQVSVPEGAEYMRVDVTSGTARVALSDTVDLPGATSVAAGLVQDAEAVPSVLRVGTQETVSVAMLGATAVILAFW